MSLVPVQRRSHRRDTGRRKEEREEEEGKREGVLTTMNVALHRDKTGKETILCSINPLGGGG